MPVLLMHRAVFTRQLCIHGFGCYWVVVLGNNVGIPLLYCNSYISTGRCCQLLALLVVMLVPTHNNGTRVPSHAKTNCKGLLFTSPTPRLAQGVIWHGHL